MNPYTYILLHEKTGYKYYGCQYAKDCDSSNFWTKYFTSSKKVKELIKEYGLDSFKFEIRKVFDDPIKCRLWEIKVIRRMKLVKRKDFLNQRNPGGLEEFIRKNYKPWNAGLKGKKDPRCKNKTKGKIGRWNDEQKRNFSEKTKQYNKETKTHSKRMLENNPGSNRRQITNGCINKRVKIEELQFWLSKGFKIGRTTNKIYINNGIVEKKINPEELNYWENLGFSRGYIPRNRDLTTGKFLRNSNENTN